MMAVLAVIFKSLIVLLTIYLLWRALVLCWDVCKKLRDRAPPADNSNQLSTISGNTEVEELSMTERLPPNVVHELYDSNRIHSIHVGRPPRPMKNLNAPPKVTLKPSAPRH